MGSGIQGGVVGRLAVKACVIPNSEPPHTSATATHRCRDLRRLLLPADRRAGAAFVEVRV